jgi:hypothetical protein
MKVFFSWSGDRSKAVVDALAPWLKQIVQALDPWISTGIAKGSRWGPEITKHLRSAQVGIVCLTQANLNNRWILFEAGALANAEDAMVATFLVDVGIEDVKAPLAQFNHTAAYKDDVRRLVHTLNDRAKAFGERSLPGPALDELFESLWPRLEAELKRIASTAFVSEGFYVLRFEKGGAPGWTVMPVNEVMKYFKVAGIFISMWTVVDETPSVRYLGIKTKASLRSIVTTLKNAEVHATVSRSSFPSMRRIIMQSGHPFDLTQPDTSKPR